jgi:hypothetical protein
MQILAEVRLIPLAALPRQPSGLGSEPKPSRPVLRLRHRTPVHPAATEVAGRVAEAAAMQTDPLPT